MKRNSILDYLSSLDVEDAETKSGKLERYVDEIMLFNPSLKLVGSIKKEDIITRHILDSASAYTVFSSMTKDGDTIADLGSGAGLPGIVLASLFPGRKFFLIERMQRRVGFLRAQKALLKLDNVTVIDKDIKEIDETFTLLTCRAFHPLSDTGRECVKLSDKAVFYKGMRKNIEKEVDEMRKEGFTFEEKIVPLSVPHLEEERNALILTSWRLDNEKR